MLPLRFNDSIVVLDALKDRGVKTADGYGDSSFEDEMHNEEDEMQR
ncbi:hypothetical protein A2U01_0087439 [Trifolium medium]|uniref:Uncharacterized protein n=1 Tax=Trifolium medium TaxID=97028 RepID=A0A392TYD5_9FABA|nr:hypothetical protein [Trifolium medium]